MCHNVPIKFSLIARQELSCYIVIMLNKCLHMYFQTLWPGTDAWDRGCKYRLYTRLLKRKFHQFMLHNVCNP